ncbi:MAG: hypothetical protein JSV14_09005 [Deltaproteobacteria bacterium]|nr:MAG: hypothetical protein JSV14_09005 [Deltaproteobacteria bacterium]
MKSKVSKLRRPACAQATALQALALIDPLRGLVEPAISARVLRHTLPSSITISNLGQFFTTD